MVQFVPGAPTPTALGTATFVTYESNYYSVMPGEGVEPSSQRPTKHPWHHLVVTPVGLCTWEFADSSVSTRLLLAMTLTTSVRDSEL